MPGYSYGIPTGMVFKKYYCSRCGNKLIKEKNHRIVSKEDVDYYHYHEIGTFPKYDHSVYSYHFKCPNCNNRYSFNYQCVIERIQKYKKRKVLSKNEIKENRVIANKQREKHNFIRDMIIGYIFIILCLIVAYLIENDFQVIIIFGIILLGLITYSNIKRYFFSYQRIKRNVISKREVDYSPDEKFLLNYLYSYSYNNKSDIEESTECYCFGCNKKIVAKEIVEFDEDLHARCPYCGNRSILADSIDEVLSDYIVELMHRYWF